MEGLTGFCEAERLSKRGDRRRIGFDN